MDSEILFLETKKLIKNTTKQKFGKLNKFLKKLHGTILAYWCHNLDTFITIITEDSLLKTTTCSERIFLHGSKLCDLEKK